MAKYGFIILIFLIVASDATCQRYFGYEGSSPDDTHQPVELAAQDNNALIQAELQRREDYPDQPIQFATDVFLGIDVSTAASWEYTADNVVVGKLRLYSEDANSLNLHFSEFFIGPQTVVNLYNPETGYSRRRLDQSDVESHRQLWTPIVRGEHLMIEIVTTESEQEQLSLRIRNAYHDYIGFNQVFQRASGACNIDVACGEADGHPEVDQYRQQISSVGAYHFNGQEICSGVAINNTELDCTPYFLTANHCGINQETAQSMVVYWNYENSTCREPHTAESEAPGDGTLDQYNIGAIFRAREVRSDFALVELDDPIDPSYQVYLSGWYSGPDVPKTTVAIHHPGVQEKRISFDYDEAEIDYSSSSLGYRLRVNEWDIGTTEIGSSGCPLYNEDGLIVGQLVGGTASCDLGGFDLFGWFHKSWVGNNDETSSLRSWLDPQGENPETLYGHTCSYQIFFDDEQANICSTQEEDFHQISIQANSAFSEPAMLEIVEDAGLDISFLVTQLDHNTNAVLRVNQVHDIQNGHYPIKIGVVQQQIDIDLDIDFEVVDDSPVKTQLTSPAHQAVAQGSTMTFRWDAHDEMTLYDIQISNDPGFVTVYHAVEGLTDNQITIDNVPPNQTYYWKVKGNNVCGDGQWSSVRSFTTEFQFCTKIVQATPVTIQDEAGIYYYDLELDHDVNIKSLQIDNVRGTHDYISDLYFWLEKGLNQVFLWGGGCGSLTDYSIGFSIDSDLTPSCPIRDGRIYKPAQTYQGLLNTNAQGLYRIRIEDKENGDGGTIDQAEITICFDEVYDEVIVPASNTIFICEEEVEFDVYSNVASKEDIQFEIENSFNQEVPFKIHSNLQGDNGIYRLHIDKSDLEGVGEINLKAYGHEHAAETQVVLLSGESSQANAISYPFNGQVISDEMMIEFRLDHLPSLSTELQISTDEDFYNIIYSVELTDSDIVLVDLELAHDTEYFARTLNADPTKSCRGISETVSIFGSPLISSTDDIPSQSFSVIPNPADDHVLISTDASRSPIQRLDFYTLTGQKVISQSKGSNVSHEASLDVSHLPTGIYLIRVQLEDTSYLVQKISVQ